ncbi:conjugal transfer protein [Paramaledivibacter caminithermalis]|jgi:hypothetical protein|uniref:Conjugative transposon protein TcpC n=1 Tax=Paramaledivibacter caminithermalis (strain DSM 15212 / CIP 107654 / DViRD3) TaxID=1121301 RepID=A0A1M6SRY3_PARC5|nr:conjugal transfer protein [Paramaledivibacter caminithermalis]SHK47455.1 Conjugative transposon protein TcpC [Paramaledivibacter caminithermalis DSM 15212]
MIKLPFKSKDIKTTELNKGSIQRIIRLMFWTFLFFLLLKSVIGVFKPSEKIEIPEIKLEQQMPASVAESFVKEYLTYNISSSLEEKKEYEERVYTFLADYVKLPTMIGIQADSKVENTYVYEIKKLKTNQYDVIVKADTVYTFVDGQRKKKSIYLKVPVAEQEGKFVVEDTPIIIPKVEKASIKYERYSEGDELNITEAFEVKEIMANFFKTYCTGKPSEIAYYMDDGKPRAGFEKSFEFLDIMDFRVHYLENIGYKAIAEIKIRDVVSNKEFLQNYNIDIVNKDGRWYIKGLNLRGGNIHEEYEKTDKEQK